MNTGLIRFDTPPKALSSRLSYKPFDVYYGTVEVEGKPMLVAIWRRQGAQTKFEGVSADFVRDFVYPQAEGVREVRLPYQDDEVQGALASLRD